MKPLYKRKDTKVELARLDGYLQGIAILQGHWRDYRACAYLVTMSGGAESIGRDINRLYSRQTHFEFSSVEKLPRGMGELEAQLRAYITRNPLGASEKVFDTDAVNVCQLNTSFWIMDMVDAVIEAGRLGTGAKPDVYKLTSADAGYGSSDFFCILLRRRMLVLQFLDSSAAGNERGR